MYQRVLCDSSRDSDSSPFYSDSDSSPFYSDSDSSPVFFSHFDSDSDSDSEIVTRDSGPSHARVLAVAAVPCCAVYSDIRYILLYVFMFWRINKC